MSAFDTAWQLLKNFEVDPDGGYRRINGYSPFGGGSAARPNSSNSILGLQVYADGVIASSGTNVYFSQTGTSWLEINRASVASSGDNHTAFTGRSVAARTGQGFGAGGGAGSGSNGGPGGDGKAGVVYVEEYA